MQGDVRDVLGETVYHLSAGQNHISFAVDEVVEAYNLLSRAGLSGPDAMAAFNSVVSCVRDVAGMLTTLAMAVSGDGE